MTEDDRPELLQQRIQKLLVTQQGQRSGAARAFPQATAADLIHGLPPADVDGSYLPKGPADAPESTEPAVETRELRKPRRSQPPSSLSGSETVLDVPKAPAASPGTGPSKTRSRIRRPLRAKAVPRAYRSRLRVLFLGADADPRRRLRIDRELRQIVQAFEMAQRLDETDLRSFEAVRADDLQKLFLRHRPELVHIAAHGGPDHILMDGELHGETVPLAPLCRLLTRSTDVRCVLLNACHSEAAASVLLEHADTAVVAMNRAIKDRSAIEFAQGFYIALGFGESIESAFEQGRLLQQIKEQPGADIPRLFGSPNALARRFFNSM